jgi:hypothetical protein
MGGNPGKGDWGILSQIGPPSGKILAHHRRLETLENIFCGKCSLSTVTLSYARPGWRLLKVELMGLEASR